ncbi:MAG: hypothetical protein CR991_07865 [Proteobacteria bacterium]|nr:MAG: hypothetical protein CR991_07865 [Pseudomonadota bacterium]
MIHNDLPSQQLSSLTSAHARNMELQQQLHVARGKAQPAYVNRPSFDSRITQGIINLIQQLISLLHKSEADKPKPIHLSQAQFNELKRLAGFNKTAPIAISVLDADGDGEVSVGDTLVVSGGIHGDELFRRTLNERDISIFNQQFSLPEAFTQNQNKWNSLANVNNSPLEYTLQQSCFCPNDYTRPMNINEQNGRIKSAHYADTGEAVPNYIVDSLLTINERFEQLQDAYESDAEQVQVTYDAQYGFPSSVFIDQSTLVADEEMAYTIKDFNWLKT